MKTTFVAQTIIRDGGRVLLVEQQGPNDEHPSWSIPGGRVHDGELIAAAAIREVYEETGIEIQDAGEIVYLARVTRQHPDEQLIAFVMEVRLWSGTIKPCDPDNFILQVCFVPIAEAADKIEATQSYIPMRDPIVSYLRGEVYPDTIWHYAIDDQGAVQLIDRFGTV